MEFPDVGKNCSLESCNKFDFLPVKCDACSKFFCLEHMKYADHNCSEGNARDVQVSVCPLCNKLIPYRPGEHPDEILDAHLDADCQGVPADDKNKTYVYKCSTKGCKRKEFVEFLCSRCHNNFCVRHRHPTDHQCSSK